MHKIGLERIVLETQRIIIEQERLIIRHRSATRCSYNDVLGLVQDRHLCWSMQYSIESLKLQKEGVETMALAVGCWENAIEHGRHALGCYHSLEEVYPMLLQSDQQCLDRLNDQLRRMRKTLESYKSLSYDSIV